MSELIDRDRLIRRLDKLVKKNADYTMTKAYIQWFAEQIRNERRVNAIVPIKCRDCRFYKTYDGTNRCCRPETFARGGHGLDMRPGDWCCYAARREK